MTPVGHRRYRKIPGVGNIYRLVHIINHVTLLGRFLDKCYGPPQGGGG